MNMFKMIYYFVFIGKAIAELNALSAERKYMFNRHSQKWQDVFAILNKKVQWLKGENKRLLTEGYIDHKVAMEVDRAVICDNEKRITALLQVEKPRLIEKRHEAVHQLRSETALVQERMMPLEAIIARRQAFNRAICWPVRWLMPKRA